MKKLILITLCILYVLSPIDFVPDLLWGIGWLDDLAAIGLTVHQLTEGSAGKGREVS